ncbi:hypothetical protein TRVL_09794 [Trypanosoma vivax]|nr:hypothetical protein TRVL_09794 [Trypanosoma vivax]
MSFECKAKACFQFVFAIVDVFFHVMFILIFFFLLAVPQLCIAVPVATHAVGIVDKVFLYCKPSLLLLYIYTRKFNCPCLNVRRTSVLHSCYLSFFSPLPFISK